jgi:hypothetical protein
VTPDETAAEEISAYLMVGMHHTTPEAKAHMATIIVRAMHTRHDLTRRSQRPRAVWKRRKNELRRKAKPDCTECGGRGIIVRTHTCPTGNDPRSDECGCTNA